MQVFTDLDNLERLKTECVVFILLGGNDCNVCHILRPQLASLLVQHFPDTQYVNVDCEVAPDICAQHSSCSLDETQCNPGFF